MSRATAWTVHLAVLLTAASGLFLCWIVFFADPGADASAGLSLEPEDELMLLVGTHPWQPLVVAIHILAAPLAVFAAGLVWRGHVWLRIQTGMRERRRTGLLLTGLLAPLVVSGYLLQVAVADQLRLLTSWSHAGAGVLFAVVYAVHQLGRRETARIRNQIRTRPPESSAAGS